MRIDCTIVEDEPLAQERILAYLAKLPFIHLLGSFDNGIDALAFLQTAKADLIFLDINMGDFSGIRLLESMKITSQVVISTAYHEYALKGFELNVTDYLLKPYTFDRFVQAVDKARQNLVKAVGSPPDRKYIFIRTEYRLDKLLLDDLLYIEGMRDYRRVHKSFMVALGKIDSVEKDVIRIW